MFKYNNFCKKFLNRHLLILIIVILSNNFGLSIPIESTSGDAVTLDLNSMDTLKSLEELIETVRKIRADSDANVTTTEATETELITTLPTEKSTIISTTTTTTENSNLLDLESSFGGLGNVREVKQPEKLNGFYFLADINSFLEVGDGDEKVVIRFNPKIGNPNNFIPIPGSRT